MPSVARLIVAVLFATVIGAGAASADCAVSDPVKPAVTIDEPPVVYDHSLSRAAVKQREELVNHVHHAANEVVLGTTETEIQPNAQVKIQAVQNADGRFCATVASLKTVISWKMVVHVAAEIKAGSCMYGVVLAHENGHVDIARGLMGMAKDLITRAMTSVANKGALAETPDAAYKALQSIGTTALNKAMTKLTAEMKRRQQVHDNPEEYAKGKKVCGLVEYRHALGD
jgi:hypothetical protein